MYHNNKKKRMARGGNVDYGLGGALLKLGSNLAQGKGFGSGALKGVGKAAITPGSGIGAGAELAGNLLQKSNNPALQGVGKGLGIASNFAPGGGGVMGALGGLAGGGAGGAGGGGGLLNMASQFLGERGMKVKLMKKGGVVYAEGGVNIPEGEEMEVSIAPQAKRPLDNVLFGEREELTDREGKMVGEVFEPSKLRKLFGGPDVKASFRDGGYVSAAGGVKLMKKVMDEGGESDPPRADFLMSGQPADPEESQPFANNPAILSGDPLRGDLIGIRMPSETTQAVADLPSFGYGEYYTDPTGEGELPEEAPTPESPEDLAPISSRGPRVIRSGSDKELVGGTRQAEEPRDMETFAYTAKKGSLAGMRPGRGFVSTGKGGPMKQITFTPESMAAYLFENQGPQKPFKSMDEALKRAQEMYGQAKQSRPDAKEYDIFEFMKRASSQPFGGARR